MEAEKKEEKPILTYGQIADLAFTLGTRYGELRVMGHDYNKFQCEALIEIHRELQRTKDASPEIRNMNYFI